LVIKPPQDAAEKERRFHLLEGTTANKLSMHYLTKGAGHFTTSRRAFFSIVAVCGWMGNANSLFE